jgi:hypothetical protein
MKFFTNVRCVVASRQSPCGAKSAPTLVTRLPSPLVSLTFNASSTTTSLLPCSATNT